MRAPRHFLAIPDFTRPELERLFDLAGRMKRGDYRENWKLNAVVYVRDTEEAMTEVYPKLMAPDTNWQVYREYYCPSCGVMHDIEAPTPWYPVIHDFEPDIEAFYKDWIGLPVPDKAA